MASTRVVLAWLVCAVAVAGARAQQNLSSPTTQATPLSCTTPLGEPGECVPIQQCDQFFPIYRQNRTFETLQYLRQFICQSEERYTWLCCATNQLVDPGLDSMPSSRILIRPHLPVTTTRPEASVTPQDGTASSEESLLQHRNINLLPMDMCGGTPFRRIFGGNKTSVDEFPWAALLEYEKVKDGTRMFACGGSLISRRYVLTAVNCTSHRDPRVNLTLMGVYLGENDIRTNPDCEPNEKCRLLGVTNCPDDCADESVKYTVEEEIAHPLYSSIYSSGMHHDIALLRLSADVAFTGYIEPICIPIDVQLARKSYAGNIFTVFGWGRTEEGMGSPVKLKAEQPVLSNEECSQVYAGYGVNFNGSFQMCAGGEEGVSACRGDSGGALMGFETIRKRRKEVHALGVVSYGDRYCHRDTPTVYTRVAAYSRWILDQLKP